MRLEELSAADIADLDRNRTVVVLPIGSLEQHGGHLPLGTDTFIAHAVGLRAAERRPGTLVLPPPWYGFSAHHMNFAGTVTLAPETLQSVIDDIVESLLGHGFPRIAIVNGHGGNTGVLDVACARLGHRHRGRARIAGLTYFHLARDAIASIRKSRPGGTGHAGEFETAVMQHLRPDLVKLALAATHYPDPGSAYLSTDLLASSLVRTYQDFAELSPTGTFGDPALASPEQGALFFDACVGALTAFLEEFADWPISHRAQ